MTSSLRWGSTCEPVSKIPPETLKRSNDRDLSDIVTALYGLPVISQDSLRHENKLGEGAYGLVTLEKYNPRTTDAYFVAVKYLVTRGRLPDELHHAYTAVRREIRVLTHPPLKNHLSILRAIGHGTANIVGSPADPYLVLEYSEHGTLDKYALSRTPPHNECRELVLDVAIGLKALHDNKIIHGDVKPHNVLVFNAGYHTSPLRSVAKISDFGHALTEAEIKTLGVRPIGTAAYRAPELDNGIGGPEAVVKKPGELSLFESLCRTDVYSFGLLMWTIFQIRDCEAYRDEMHTNVNYRHSIHSKSNNGMVEAATSWVQGILMQQYSSSDDAAVRQQLSAIDAALRLCLSDRAQDRAPMSLVISALTIASGERRSQRMYAPTMLNVPRTEQRDHNVDETTSLNQDQPYATENVARWSFDYKTYKRPDNPLAYDHEDPVLTFQESHILLKDLPPPSTPAQEITTLVHTRRPYKEVAPQPVSDHTIDVFEAGLLQLPLWDEQVRIYESFLALTESNLADGKLGNAWLQLAGCYFTGFGTSMNYIEGSWCLDEASKTNFIGMSLKTRAWPALSNGEVHLHPPPVSQPQLNMTEMGESMTDFAASFRDLQQHARRQVTDVIVRRMDAYSARDHIRSATNYVSPDVLGDRFMLQLFTTRHVSDMLASKRHSVKKTSLGLTLACQFGMLKVAESMAKALSTFISVEGSPTPLHWLISFEPMAAASLAGLLVNGTNYTNVPQGICKHLLNVPVDEPIKFPEHAMALFGTPLHWAVRVGSLALVKALVSLGADINARCFPRFESITDPSWGHMPYQSPLDVAAMFHHAQIVDYLLQEGAHTSGGDGHEHHTALHMVGQLSHPLARMVIHGSSYRRCLGDTIQNLLQAGLDINTFAKPYAILSYTPLRWALQSLRTEKYIVEALLEHGASEPNQLLPQDPPLVVLVAHSEANRPTSTWKLKAVLHLVKDINERSENLEYARNALHFCIQNENKGMVELLANVGYLDFEARVTPHRYTPLMYGVVLGKTEMVRWLANNGASVEPIGSDEAPLEMAVRLRHLEVIVVLLSCGASVTFGPIDPIKGLPRWSILHQAVMGPSKDLRKSSFMRPLLERLPNLKTASILNQKCSSGTWTPLHFAAVQGDFEAVQALLDAGADSSITNEQNATLRASLGYTSAGSPLEVVKKYIYRFDKKGPIYGEQPWLRDCERDSPEARHFRNSLEEIQVLLSQAQIDRRK